MAQDLVILPDFSPIRFRWYDLIVGRNIASIMGRAVEQRVRVQNPSRSYNSIESTLNTYFYVPKLPFDEQTMHPGHLKHSRYHALRHQPRTPAGLCRGILTISL